MSMSIQVKDFFSKLDDKELFMFKKLYYQPEQVLGEKKEEDREAEQDYKNSFYYCDLMMNNNLSNFIISVFYDDDFMERVEDNYQIWQKFGYFLYDSKDFKKYYGFTDDEELLLVITDKMPYRKYLDNHKPKYPLMAYYDAYKKYRRLFDHSYPKEQIESYDEYKANEARSYLQLIGQVIREEEDKKLKKEYSLERIKKEDYTLDIDTYCGDKYLYNHNLDNIGLDSSALDALVCENRFLEIIEEKINNNQIEGKVINNVMDIINMGIDIKKNDSYYSNLYRGRIGEETVKSYNVKYAKEIMNKLSKIRGREYKKVFTPNKKEIYVMNNMI